MRRGLSVLAFLVFAGPAWAQDRDVPYWASLRAAEVNMRAGPGENFPVEWVYRRQGLPVRVVRVMQGWRFVEDPDGTRGWVVARLLTPDRGALVTGEGLADMRAEPSASAALRWRVEPGVSGALGPCEADWCELDVAGRKGWVRAERLWGAGEP